MIIAAAKLELFLPETHSLKEKRQILKRLIGRTSQEFDVRVAEVGFQDLWQRTALGFALVGSDRDFLTALADRIVRFVESMDMAPIVNRRVELIDFED